MEKLLIAEHLTKVYGEGDNKVIAVNDISIEIRKGEFVAIVGKSGSGKSTLLHLLGGLDTPTGGKIILDGRNLAEMREKELAVFRRRKIGFIFQAFNLLSSLNVWENIVLPIGLDGGQVDTEFVNEIVKMLEIDNKLNCLPNMLSGGQQQRVAIARALASKPEIIFADEPTGNLDSKTGGEVMNLLKTSIKKFGQTLVMITHDSDLAHCADRMITVRDGEVGDEA